MDREIEFIRRLPVLLLMTYRPEFIPPWIGEPHVSTIALGRLDPQSCADLIERITDGNTLPSEVLEEITERADGIPLFIEELTKAVLEVSADGRDAAGTLAASFSRSVPATLHASLMARFDRLGPAKEVAQTGAAIGREFRYDLLAAISPLSEQELRSALERLISSGLLFGRGTPPDASYLFKHALVQDVAYGTLLRRLRRQLHARIAEALERSFPDRVDREPELLAHHFTEAQLPQRASGYWLMAGKRAAERSANLEAIKHYTKALATISALPEGMGRDRQELAAQVGIGTPLIAVQGYAAAETGTAYERAHTLCVRLGEGSALFAILSGQFAFHFVRGDPEMMRQVAKEARRASERLGDDAFDLAAYRYTGMNAMYLGELNEARPVLETILRLYDPVRHRPPPVHYIHDPKLYAVVYLGVIYWILGYPDQARRRQAAAFDYARELNQVALSTLVRIYAGAGLDELLFDTAAVHAHATAIIDLCDQHNLRYFRFSGAILKGWAMTREGAGAEGLELMRRSAAERLTLGVRWYQIRYLCMLAEAYLRQGASEEALATIAEAKDLSARHGEQMWAAELERLEGEILWDQGAPSDDVAACFRSAQAIAHHQSARSFELRAAMSLARLWRYQSREAEAHDLLAPIYGWFTEGFDTADLIEARRLLDELKASLQDQRASKIRALNP